MSEVLVDAVDTKTGEVVAVTVIPKDDMLALVKDADKGVYNAMAGMDTLDWDRLKPNQVALLIMQKPFMISGGGTTRLTFPQALLFAVRCRELGLSPFSSAVWFDPARSSVNLTLEGKRELARLRNIELGPPTFEEVYREWNNVPKITENGEEARKQGFTKDMGVICKMRVGDPKHGEHVSYTAWINDWYQGRSPVWKSKPNHMLTVRANEKALTLVLGTGISSLPSDQEIGE